MWIVRLNKPRKAFNMLGQRVQAAAGQRVMLPEDEAYLAADTGEVEILSPAGIAVYRSRDIKAESAEKPPKAASATSRLYKRRDMKADE